MNAPTAPTFRRLARLVPVGLLLACAALVPVGCKKGPQKLKVAYLGLTCEAPIFVAYEKGFFKEEGLDVELVRTDWDGLRDGLGLGRFDANHTLVMYLLQPIAGGLDVKITGGIHTHGVRPIRNKRMRAVLRHQSPAEIHAHVGIGERN